MKILITGGTGIIGTELTHSLTDAGHEVVVLGRGSQPDANFPQNVVFLHWDGKTAHGWTEGLDGAQAVVNLAGANLAGEGFFPSRWTESRKRLIRESRINASNALLEAISRVNNKPAVLIQSSAVGYYGPLPDRPVDETESVGTDFLAQLCKDWENSSRSVISMGVKHVVTRTGVVLTTRGGALSRMLLPYKLFLGGPFGNGKQVMSWIHLRDVIRAIQFLIENQPVSGVFNLTSPNPVTNAEMGKVIARVLHRPYWIPLPGVMMRLMFGEVATVVLDGQRVLPRRLLENGFTFTFPEIEPAIRDIVKS